MIAKSSAQIVVNCMDDLVAIYPKLLARARMLLSNEAEDLVQETCRLAIQHASQYQPDTNYTSWVFTILYNTFKSRLTYLSRHPVTELFDNSASVDPKMPTELPVMLSKVPASYGEALYMHYVLGMSCKEIARGTGCTVGTICGYLKKGRDILRNDPDICR